MDFDVGDNKMTKEEAVFVLRSRRNQCKEMAEAVDMAIEALIQEPRNDAISRQAVLNMDFKRIILTTAKPTEIIVQKIKDLPSVQPQQKTGHWEYKRTRIAGKELLAGAYCSECKEECTVYHSEIFNYCPNCGAKMEVDK